MPSPNHRTRASLTGSATGAALRRGDLKISDPIPFDTNAFYATPQSGTRSSKYPSGLRADDSTWPRNRSPGPEFHYRHASAGNIPNNAMRASAGPSLMPSSMASIPSKSSLNQKKQSGFRAALKRMFSSKRHRSVPNDLTDPQYFHGDPPYSDPVREPHTVNGPDPIPTSNKTLQIAHQASHPLHQHPDLHAEQTIEIPTRRGRRNTLPSLVFSDRESVSARAVSEWSGTESHQEKKWVKEDYVSDGQLKRRSRSADALNEMLRQGNVETDSKRDRASEIAYWRNSAIQNPVPVFSGQSIAVDPVHVPHPVASIDEFEHASSVVDPLQTFDFGLDGNDRDETTIEQRVNTLEIKLFDFEYAIAKLQGNELPKPMLNPKPNKRGSLQNIFPEGNPYTELASTSSEDFTFLSSPGTTHDMTFLSSPGESPTVSPERDDLFRPNRASKATTATIRPSTARRRSPRPSSSRSAHRCTQQYDELLELIKEEQSARRKLEEQVLGLQRELEVLRNPVFATIREAPYPTPSPESSHTTTTPRSLHRAPPFRLSNAHEISRFSGTEADSDPDEGDGFEDVYETPQDSRKTFETARGSPAQPQE